MRSKSRQSRSGGRRREIVEAALACFGQNGLEATTIEDVRSRSAASTGSIYHHFGGKEGLAAEVYRPVLGEYHRSLLALLPELHDGRALVEGVVRHFAGWVSANRDAARFLIEMRFADGVRDFDEGIRQDTAGMLAAVAEELGRRVRNGEIRELPRHLYAPVLIGPVMAAAARWVRDGSEIDLTADAGALAGAAWRALAPAAAGSTQAAE